MVMVPASSYSHTLWVFDLTSTAHLTANHIQSTDGTMNILNGLYMNAISGFMPAPITAIAQWAGGASINPGPYDAVVFLISNRNQSIISRLGLAAQPDSPNQAGWTAAPVQSGGIAEVYWEQCMNDFEVAGSIFHEAAHLKSDANPGMHDFYSPGIGGEGVRVLSRTGTSKGGNGPSSDDMIWYANWMPNVVSLPMAIP